MTDPILTRAEELQAHILCEQSTKDYWRIRVFEPADRPLRRGYDCDISTDEAFASKDALWWAERANGDMARYEAESWATDRAREMAARAFNAEVRT